MSDKKYSKVLTIILIVTAILAVGVLGFLGYDIYKKHAINKSANEAIEEFNNEIVRVRRTGNTVNDNITNEANVSLDIGNMTESSEGGSTSAAVKTYKGFTMNGIIEIPSIKLKYPVLDRATKASMEASVGIAYGPGLNQVGNTVIMGHNYRNGTFFSDLEKVTTGDAIYITDNTVNRVKYTAYNIYTTGSEDFEYASRDTAGKREISLSTCTDDVKDRLIIWAKEAE